LRRLLENKNKKMKSIYTSYLLLHAINKTVQNNTLAAAAAAEAALLPKKKHPR